MKRLVLGVAAILVGGMLTGCGSSAMKDGTYRAEYSEYDDHGWKDYIEVTVSDGKITDVDYDAVNDEGALKSQDTAYRESMEPVSGTYPEKFMQELEEQLVSRQEVKKVDTVAGATSSSDSFKVLATEVLEKGVKKGSTDTVVVSG